MDLLAVLGLGPPVEQSQIGRSEVPLTLIPVVIPRKHDIGEIKQTQKHPLVLRWKIPVSTCQG